MFGPKGGSKVVVQSQTEGDGVKLVIEFSPDFLSEIADFHALEGEGAIEHLQQHLESLANILALLIAGIAVSHPVLSCYGFNQLEETLGKMAGIFLSLNHRLNERGNTSEAAIELIMQVETARQILSDQVKLAARGQTQETAGWNQQDLAEFLGSIPND